MGKRPEGRIITRKIPIEDAVRQVPHQLPVVVGMRGIVSPLGAHSGIPSNARRNAAVGGFPRDRTRLRIGFRTGLSWRFNLGNRSRASAMRRSERYSRPSGRAPVLLKEAKPFAVRPRIFMLPPIFGGKDNPCRRGCAKRKRRGRRLSKSGRARERQKDQAGSRAVAAAAPSLRRCGYARWGSSLAASRSKLSAIISKSARFSGDSVSAATRRSLSAVSR